MLSRLVICIIFFFTLIRAQTIYGIVTDSDTGLPVPHCNIIIPDSNRGTVSNEDGGYRFRFRQPGDHRIVFSHIGYKSDTLIVRLSIDDDLFQPVRLHPQAVPLPGVSLLIPSHTPAEELILTASERKHQALEKLQSYSCKSYAKTVISGTEKDVPKSYALLVEYYSEVIWNAPGHIYEIVRSQKQSANLPESFNYFADISFIDVNADRFSLGDKFIVGPTAPDAIEYYRFTILDTLFQDKYRIYKLKIIPKTDLRPLMEGTIYLVDGSFLVQQVDVTFNEAADFQMYSRIHVLQKYGPVEDDLFLPYYSRWDSDWTINLPNYPEFRWKKVNFREDYRLNLTDHRQYAGISKTVYENDMDFDNIPMNPPPLSLSEIQGYTVIDSIISKRPGLKFTIAMLKFPDRLARLSTLPLGEFSQFYRFNRVEGHFMGIALHSKNYLQPFQMQGRWGYGLANRRENYRISVGVQKSAASMDIALTASLYKDISAREEIDRFPVWLNSIYSLFTTRDAFDYYYRKGKDISLAVERPPYSFAFTWNRESYLTAYRNLLRPPLGSGEYPVNTMSDEGSYSGYRIFFRFDNSGIRQSSLFSEPVTEANYLSVVLQYERAKEVGSSSGYEKGSIRLAGRRNTYHSGYLKFSLKAGAASDKILRQRRFELIGNIPGNHTGDYFRTMNLHSITGMYELMVFLEHHLDIYPFLPIRNRPGDLVIYHNMGWVGDDSFRELKIRRFIMESGIGIGPFFSLFGMDFIWRTGWTPADNEFVFYIRLVDIRL